MALRDLTFQRLKQAYSSERIQGGCASYTNQCAIRLSRAMHKAGNPITGYTDKNTCLADEVMHVRGAKTLADHIWRTFRPPERWTDGAKAKKDLTDREATGIVFFLDPYVDADHIDLWDMTQTMGVAPFETSKEVWFWSLP